MKLGQLIEAAKVGRAGTEAYPLLSMTMRQGLIPQGEKFKKRVAGADLSQYKVVQKDQLVVGFPIDEAVLAFQRTVPAGIVSPAYAVWNLKNRSATDPAYLERFLKSPLAIEFYKAKLQGSTARRRSLPNPIFLDMEVPYPPVREQRRIAAILDKADELRANRRQTIAHLDTLTQSIFHSMFEETQHQRSSVELADVVAPGTIVTYGIVQAGEEFSGGIPYIRTGDLSDGRIAAEKLRRTDPAIAAKFERSRVSAGDIVMSIRATVGTVALVPPALDGANLTQGTARIAPGPDVISSYLLEYLRAEPSQRWIQRSVKGATFKEITLDRLRRLPVTVPPLELQQTFATRVAAVERLKETHRKHLAELDALFASLQSRAFKGEL
ncbi:restriction endonuclease subunit S [Paenarthrobacter sp. AR 02]|uniref:restriction endonuclease subunit S n=1 Tax=Paenarthrobacter sp. AR 02 TaxID=2899821 RepID=UPI001F1C066A|nr:restriction endonuclease subunit S [Paenarthrobacter sp. AR 02]MCF3140513.1 restriction endonuclease subunit S [Paenarthrobacter sp. AR 02]